MGRFKKVIIGLGGNVGNRELLLESAVSQCAQLGQISASSNIYETSAWGGVAKGKFLNQVLVLETEHDPQTLLLLLQEIELGLGRARSVHWGDRTMDIDILFFGEEKLESPTLIVPHPAIANRRFVLVPLAEIMPDFIHPVLGKTISEMLAECPDQEEVSIYSRSRW